jgi:GNAT superfamily N-acetyltransferase
MLPTHTRDWFHSSEFLLHCKTFLAEKHPEYCAAIVRPSPAPAAPNGCKHIQILILYPQIHAPREDELREESVAWDDCTMETFVHDERTLDRALQEQDFVSGAPFFSRLILEGLCITIAPSLEAKLKCMAQKNLDRGPPIFSPDERMENRNKIKRALDDLATTSWPLKSEQPLAELSRLKGNLWLRGQGRWSASGPEVQRIVSLLQPELGKKWDSAFAAARQGSLTELKALFLAVLEPHAGPAHQLAEADRGGLRGELRQTPQVLEPKPLFELSDEERTLVHSELGTIHLHSATPNDALALRNLLREAYEIRARQGLNFTATYQDEEMTRDSLLKDDRQTFFASTSGTLGRTLVGTFQLCLDKGTQPVTGVSFNRFGIHPQYSGHGLGRLLLELAVDIARSRGYLSISLDTAQPATDLVSFYQRHGFKIVGQTWWDGKTYATWMMRRELLPIPTSA